VPRRGAELVLGVGCGGVELGLQLGQVLGQGRDFREGGLGALGADAAPRALVQLREDGLLSRHSGSTSRGTPLFKES